MRNNISIQICTNDLKEVIIRRPRNTHYALYRYAGRIVGFTGLRIEKVNLSNEKLLTIYTLPTSDQ